MTSVPPALPNNSAPNTASNAPSATSGSYSSLSGAVPAQQPGRSYASATKTASQSFLPPAGAPTPSQNAKPTTESPVNGVNSMAQGSSLAGGAVQNGTNTETQRQPPRIISPAGASGSATNGGPVGQNGRPPIAFGQMTGSPLPPASVPYQAQNSSLPPPPKDPRVTTPAHSPSPIPQPPASGGRVPSNFQNQNSTMTFGSMGGESDSTRQSHMAPGPQVGPVPPFHERRTSSQSMQGDPGMNRNFMPPNGRGRGYGPGYNMPAMPSPGLGYRPMPGAQSRGPSMGSQFQHQVPPGSPYQQRGGRGSPAPPPGQPHMPQQHMGGGQQMPYGGYPQMGGQGHPQQMYPYYDPNGGYYHPYGWNPQQSQSPRPPSYPSPYNAGQAPPFHPPSMSRSTSQISERPASSMGQPSTPSMQNAPTPQQAPSQPPQPANAFQRPKKGNSAIKIMNPLGGEVEIKKASTPLSAAPSQGPVIVSTPSAPTPPPRVPSSQHDRPESKNNALTAEEKKRAFQEEIKRKMEGTPKEEKPKEEASVVTPPKSDSEEVPAQKEREVADAPKNDVVEEATLEAEKAAAVDAGDKQPEKVAEPIAVEDAKVSDAKAPASEVPAEKEETDDERFERIAAEMEAEEAAGAAAEEERERAYAEKKKKADEEKAKIAAEKAAKDDEDLKRQEREAEEREEAREREREQEREAETGGDDTDEQAKDMFAALKKPTLGPGSSEPVSGTDTPASEESEASSMPPPSQPASARPAGAAAQKPKPAHLKLETSKRVEPAEPTPGMQALKSARFLEVKEELTYPTGVSSPNPALNMNGSRKGRAYDKSFLLQFKDAFKEKPSVDWDQKVKDTLGSDDPGSARPQSARTPSSQVNRSASGRPAAQGMPSFGPMGAFGSAGQRTLPPGTTSQERFNASQGSGRPGMGNMPMGRAPSQFGPPGVGMSRTNSLQTMNNMGPGSPRQTSSRGNRAGSRNDRVMTKKQEADMAAKMPLTAHLEVKSLEKSTTGWKPTSIGQPMANQPDLSGNMAPDLVQRKVKAALNKMTPSTFDRISDQILQISAQSKNETDGRTLRQVIQLTFEKACDEAHWAGMYAQFAHKMLTTMSTEIRDETIVDKAGQPVVGGALFRKYLLNRCQEEFERGWEVNLPEKPEGSSQEAALLSDDYYVAAAAKRRGLGLIQFIGQLYKLRMLTLRIMHECVMKLLNFEGDPDESAVENLTTLLRSVGFTMEEDDQGTKLLDQYFQRIEGNLLKSDNMPSRPRFMLLDLVDLRKVRWKGKDDAKGPKTIAEVHADAEAAAHKAEMERARRPQQGGRPPAGRGDARNFSNNMMPPPQQNMVGSDDLRRLQNRGNRTTGASMGPGGSLGPGSAFGGRTASKRGLGAPSSGNTTRTNTPPVEKKEEPSSQNAFNALADLASTDTPEDADTSSSATRNRSKSPMPAEKTDDNSTA